MSRGPGRIERAIRALFDASPDLAFVAVELVEHCFPGIAEPDIERKHLVSVLRAARKVIAADPDWTAWQTERQGGGLVFCNRANLHGYAMARLIENSANYRSPKRALRGDWAWGRGKVTDRAEVLAALAPGGRHHDYLAPDRPFARFVAIHIAERDGDTARAAELEAERQADLAALAAQLQRLRR